MPNYPKSRLEILFDFASEKQIEEKIKRLTKEGFKLHYHATRGYSIEIPSTKETLTPSQINERYANNRDKKEFEKANEYLILSEEKIYKTNAQGFKLS